jgi:type IV secretion system protein TrbL
MASPNIAVLDTVLNSFRTQIDSGFSTLTGPVQASLAILIVISVATMAILWAADETDHIWGHLIRKILMVGFWAYIITNWQSLAIAFISSFGKLGIGAGGGATGLSTFLNTPSQIFVIGFKDARGLFDFAAYSMGQPNSWGTLTFPSSINPATQLAFLFQQLVVMLESALAAVILIFAYGWLALEIVVTVLEFHIVTLVAFCVLPFGVLQPTRSLAENAIAYVFRAGFKAMVLGIIIGLGSTFLSSNLIVENPGALPTLNTMCGLALSVIVILMLALHAPKYASAVVAGAPSNSAGSLVGTAAGVGAAGFLAGRAAVNGGRALVSALYGPGASPSAEAARAASSLGGPGGSGGASPGAPRPPSPSPAGGGAPAAPSSGGAAFASADGPAGPASSLGPGAAVEIGAGEFIATEAAGDSSAPASPPPPTSATTLAPDAAPSLAYASGRSNVAWYATPVGLSSLTAPQLAAARRSYDLWSTANPGSASRYSFDAYVEYAQARHAESVADASQQDDD